MFHYNKIRIGSFQLDSSNQNHFKDETLPLCLFGQALDVLRSISIMSKSEMDLDDSLHTSLTRLDATRDVGLSCVRAFDLSSFHYWLTMKTYATRNANPPQGNQ